MTNLVYARLTFFWGLGILAVGLGVPMIFYALAGGGEMGVEGVAMLGLLPIMFIRFWLGGLLTVIGAIAWVTLKICSKK